MQIAMRKLYEKQKRNMMIKVISLDRESFKRLLGPIEEILKRNMDKYETFVLTS